ncbi:MAG: YggS family pyridoxal phosphate-dependent enzyme [Ignavibacteriaceae bacterium]|jgi:pyridoxal phosphate enzyme (YggS family)|nr:YggS family pyridoxal phosphate-dependent enzyme [Ignavibacteriaceae bacterium]
MIIDNLHIVEERIMKACLRAGRNRSDISLVAVSKTQPIAAIEEALKVGLIHFGENKAQELRDKNSIISSGIHWHFIGHLQTNKVKYVIDSAEYIHSVDSIKLAVEINKKAEAIGKVQKILFEIKTSSEESKFGIQNENDFFELINKVRELANIKAAGLMTMAPYTDDEKVIRECFKKLRLLREKAREKGYELTELSMGMTNDYEIAIEEGATMIRIGTALFGDRNYN